MALLFCDELKIPCTHWLPVAAIFLKLYLVLCYNTNNIEILTVDYTKVRRMPKKVLGMSLCLAGSLLNHGCDPNLYHVWYGTTAVIRARRPISKGEQLTMCYSNPATIYSLSVRREQLHKDHMFVCRFVIFF
jgi:SET domain